MQSQEPSVRLPQSRRRVTRIVDCENKRNALWERRRKHLRKRRGYTMSNPVGDYEWRMTMVSTYTKSFVLRVVASVFLI